LGGRGSGPNLPLLLLQPAEHLLFCKQFLTLFPSAFRVSEGQAQGGAGSKLHQNLPWTGEDVRAKFCQDWCRDVLSINPPHTNNIHTDKQISGQPFICILVEVPGSAWVDLQPAEHPFLCRQFSKMFPSAFSVLGPQA